MTTKAELPPELPVDEPEPELALLPPRELPLAPAAPAAPDPPAADEEELEDPFVPAPLELPPLELPPPVPTVSPTWPLSDVTTPDAGASSLVSASVLRAASRFTCALSTAAWAEATSAAAWVALTPPPLPCPDEDWLPLDCVAGALLVCPDDPVCCCDPDFVLLVGGVRAAVAIAAVACWEAVLAVDEIGSDLA
jgi:hypothetical protein